MNKYIHEKRVVVFVAGADFSGTTLLDFILGSSLDSSSLGEIYPFVRPTTVDHRKVACSCNKDCGLWSEVKDTAQIYTRLFKQRSSRVLIDSSKHPMWIKSQMAKLDKQGIESRIVLIWKNPGDYAQSCASRGRGDEWANKWIRYHQALSEIGRPYYSVNLEKIVAVDQTELESICNYTGIRYDENMFEYWEKEHHIIFGSATARLKLFKENSEGQSETKKTSKKILGVLTAPASSTRKQAEMLLDIQQQLEVSGEKTPLPIRIPVFYWRIVAKKYFEILFYKAGISPVAIAKLKRKLVSALPF